jgi:hypothetical protein
MVLSVPHTGTRFVCRKIEPHAKVRPVHTTDIDAKIRRHADASEVVIVPVRRPEDCWFGWGKRGKDRPHEFLGAWVNLQRWCDELSEKVEVFPVDHPAREAARMRIGARLGVTLDDNWTPVGREHGRITEAPCPDVSWLPVLAGLYL